MTADEIKKMFLLNAELSKIPPCVPQYEQGQAVLNAMTTRYMAENVMKQKPNDAETPDWQKALGYLSEVFQKLDACETDEKMIDFRRSVWETVADAVQIFYQDPNLEPMRKKILEMRNMQAN